MLKKCTSLILLALGVMPMAHAGSTTAKTPTLIEALSSCQQDFFTAIHAQRDRLSKVTTIKERSASVAWISVSNRTDSKADTTRFSSPYQDGSLKLFGYFDEIDNLGPLGVYYSWGFFVPGNVRQVAEQLRPFIQDNGRFRQDGDAFVRSDLWEDGHWRKDDQIEGGTVPAKGTVERVLLIEDGAPEWPGFVRVGCSLQGSVSPEVLLSERPDL